MEARSTIMKPGVPEPRTWDGRLARRLIRPLVGTRITPNHLTTLRLAIGLAGAVGLASGDYLFANVGALLVALSNFVDHTDGELARISGQSSRLGHLYDLVCDAVVTVLTFATLGFGAAGHVVVAPAAVLGLVAGCAIALIFFVRMRIEDQSGKAGTAQAFAGGFEVEDVLYLLPIVTLASIAGLFVLVAAVGSSLYAAWVLVAWARLARRAPDGAWTR